ncbi:hypothetical protein LCGC14_0102910 [marine sediment metagenome]|uniref:AtpZ/AtpI family protein n=1 Tax=marine sediment metagenome TaxID=412755 RepID=A0A0F9VCH2_9ZZZZ
MNQKREKDKKERAIFLKTLSLAWELGYIIVIPLVILAAGGRFLDNKYDTSPIFLMSGILLSILVSGILVFKKAKRILEDISNQ